MKEEALTTNIPEIVEALRLRSIVLFIGADLTRAITGLPPRADLARELAHRKKLDGSLSLAEVAQRVGRAGNRWEFTAFIRDALDTAGRSPQPFHRHIVELVRAHDIKTVITTAYDTLLELAFQEAGAGINRVIRGSDVSFINPDRPALIKLYGEAQQPDTLVVTDRDHSDLLRDREREPVLDEVRRALRLNTVLFLGYNLADPDFRFLFDQIAESRFARTAYAVWPGLPEADVRMWRDRGIVILDTDPFGILSEYVATSPEPSSITLKAPPPSEESMRERRKRSHLVADNCPDVTISFDLLLEQTEGNDPQNWAGVRLRGNRSSRDGYFIIARGDGRVEIVLVRLGSRDQILRSYMLPRVSRAMRFVVNLVGMQISVELNSTEIMSCEADQYIHVGGAFLEACRATATFSNLQINPRQSDTDIAPPKILDNRVTLLTPSSHTARRSSVSGSQVPSDTSADSHSVEGFGRLPRLGWDMAAIRQLLTTAFNDEELTTLCFDHFRPAYEDLSSGMSKGLKIQRLLDYCDRHGHLEELVERVRKQNPVQYDRFRDQLEH